MTSCSSGSATVTTGGGGTIGTAGSREQPISAQTRTAQAREWRARIRSAARDQPPQHVLQDAAVAVVLGLVGRVDAYARVELDRLAVVAPGAHAHGASGLEGAAVELGDLDVERLVAGEAERLRALALRELERQDAHADQVGAVDALEALRERGAHAEQRRALGGPVARRAGAVFFAGQNDGRHALLLVLHGGVEDRGRLLVREVQGRAALDAGCELVPQAH